MSRVFVLSCLFIGCVLGAGMFDEEEAERQLIAETTLGVTVMYGGEAVEKVATGGYFTVALFSNHSVRLDGMGESGRWIEDADGQQRWRDVQAGLYTVYLTRDDDRLFVLDLMEEEWSLGEVRGTKAPQHLCGGYNFEVLLSADEEALVGVPLPLASLCCGSNFAVAVSQSGELAGKGSSAWGAPNSTTWTSIEGVSSIHMNSNNQPLLACGGDHIVAIVSPSSSSSSVTAWGWGEFGQVGPQCSDAKCSPVRISMHDEVVALFAGGYGHSGAILRDGDVFGWGWAKHGQLGEAAQALGEIAHEPVKLPLDNVKAITSGSFKHTVALLQNNTVVAMGSNAFQQIKQHQPPM